MTEIGIEMPMISVDRQVPEEREDDQDDEDRPEQGRLLDRRYRVLDVPRTVVEDQQLDARHRRVDPLDLLPHPVGHRNGVLARLLRHLHPHAGAAVDPHQRARVLGGVLDLRDVAHVDRNVVPAEHDDVPDLLQVLELPLVPEQVRHVAFIHQAEGRVLVVGAQLADDLVDRQVEGGDLLLRQQHVDLAPQPAAGRHRGDPDDALHPRRQLALGDLAQRDPVVVSLDPEAHDRHRR
jgi:hypothetical protein